MENKKVDLTLKVNAEVDSASFAAAREAAADIAPEPQGGQGAAGALPGNGKGAEQASAAAAAERQLAAARQAAERSAADEAAQIEALKAQMALEAKGRAGLIAELERLQRARVAAAKAGDVEAYKKLETQMKQTRAAFELMNQGLEVSRIGMMGQMQVAMGAMGAMQSLGAEVENGTVSLTGMANAVYAVGAAIKAGMGPVGWALMAVQALQMAMDSYFSDQQKKQQAQQENLRQQFEDLQKLGDEMRRMSGLERSNLLEGMQAEVDGVARRQEEMAAARATAQREEAMLDQASDNRRLLAAQALYDSTVARIELEKTLGELTENEAARRQAAADESLAAEQAAIRQAAIQRTIENSEALRRQAQADADELEERLESTYGKFDRVLRVDMPSNDEWEALRLKLQNTEASAAEQAEGKRVRDQLQVIRGILQEMGQGFTGTNEELLAWLHEMQDARKEGRLRVEELRKQAVIQGQETRQAELSLELEKEEAAAAAKKREAAAQQQAAQLAAAERSREWQEVQRGSLEEQAEWLRQTAEQFREGSAEAQRWTEALRAVQARRVAEELGALSDTYRVTGSYARQDSRTQAEIYRADEQALEARRDALEALRRSPDVDAATLRQINARLEETQEQLRGVRDAMRDNATAARRWLCELEPPRVQAAKKSYEAAMKRHAQAYTRAAKRAEKAAEAGNEKELARAQQSMGRYARAMERLAKKPGQVEAMHSEALRKTNEALRSADDGRQADRDAARAKDRTAKAAQREAREAERSAREARRRDDQGVSADSGQQVEQLTGKLQQLQAQAAAMLTALQQAASGIASLTAAAGQAVAAAQQLAAATSAGFNRLNGDIKSLQAAVNNIRRR